MIVTVRGILETAGPDWIHVRIGGISLQVFMPANAVVRLGVPGDEVLLHTHLRIRDEQPVLFGFPDATSLHLFSLLTGVAGVGPRLGLSLLSALEPASLQMAVVAGDVTALASAPGVGRRTASRIVLELKGKIESSELTDAAVLPDGDNEVVAALSAVGYTPSESKTALENVPQSDAASVEERIRLALQQFASRS